MPKARGPESMMWIFLIILVVGVLMATLPPLVFGAAEGDRDAQPFTATLLGWAVAAIGAVGAAVSWFLKRRS